MSLDDLNDDVQAAYSDLGDAQEFDLDRETKNELAMLLAATDVDDEGELIRRAIHQFFQATVETGQLDFHLRTAYDVTYDEYLSDMTYEEMTGGSLGGGSAGTGDDHDRRYQF